MPTEPEPWYGPWANGSREVTSCTIDEHDPPWLRIEAISTEISARTNTVPFQRQGPRTNEFDHKFSVFEPEPEPHGVLPGIEEVLFAVIEGPKTEEVEGPQGEGDIPGIGEGQCQQEDSRQVSEDAPIEIEPAIDDTRDPRNVNDAPGDAHTENDPERHDDKTNVPNAADKDGEVSSETARDIEDESNTSDDTHAIAAAPEQQTKSMELLPQTREIIVGATNAPIEADNEKEASNEAARDNEKDLDINDDAPAIAAPKQQTEPTEVSPQKREIIVDNGHEAITGRYPLFELLSLSTTSGAISVAVVPQPADPIHPDEPARLRIRSQSGSISVSFTAPAVASVPELERQMVECAEYGNGKYQNPHTLPLRPYEIEIETDSGTISGRFIVSTSVHLSTKSGSINANLIPIASDLEQSVSILTQTTSGSQQIHLTNPVYLYSSQRDRSRSSATRAPAAHFSHGGGSMQIRYPFDWTGIVRAPPGSGSTSLVGQGMNVVRREDGSVEGCISGNGRGDWWGASGMDVSLGSRGAAMFLVG